MQIKDAIERMQDLIHTCDIGIEKHGAYDDLFQKDKDALETILKKFNEYEKYYQNEINLFNKYIPKQKILNEIEKLNKKEKELQDSISQEEREEYSDAGISHLLMDIHIRREVLQDILKEEEKQSEKD
jgi:hypothetical protein